MMASGNNFTYEDLEEISKIYATEFNNDKIHDRVLVFDIVKDELCEFNMGKTSFADFSDSSDSDVDFEIVSKDFVTLSKVANRIDRKRPASEENSPLSSLTIVKRSREDPLEISEACEAEIKIACEAGSLADGNMQNSSSSEMKAESNAMNTETEHRKNVIEVDNETPIGSKEKASEMNSEPQPSSYQISSTNPSPDPEILRQHKVFVHTTWLAVHSEYFRSLFYSGMKESSAKEVHLKVPECEEKGHLMMLEAIYRPYILDTASIDELLLVLELADKYNVNFVFRKCIYMLQSKKLTLEICEKIMHVIQVKHNMTSVSNLTDRVQKHLVEVFSPLDTEWNMEEFENLSEPLLRSLLSSNDVATQSENTVFYALMDWIVSNHYDISTNDPSSTSLLTLVRFELMSIDYLYNIVQHHPIATKMAHFAELYLKGISYHALSVGIRNRLDQPVERATVGHGMAHLTWIIHKDQLDSLNHSEAKIFSPGFVACGYVMHMSLKKKGPLFHRHGTIFLRTHGLTGKSDFLVHWHYECDSFSSNIDWGYHTFSKNHRTMASDVCLKHGALDSIAISIFIELVHEA